MVPSTYPRLLIVLLAILIPLKRKTKEKIFFDTINIINSTINLEKIELELISEQKVSSIDGFSETFYETLKKQIKSVEHSKN